MKVISFKNTILLKRGMWLTAVALMAVVATPWVLDGSFQREPVVHVIPMCILGSFWIYFLRKMQFHRLADEVTDCEDYLKVRKGQLEETIPFSNVSKVDVSTSGNIHRITICLHQPTKLGGQIVFLPQASLWSNLAGVKRVAMDLTERATQANDGRGVK
jgi:hypothetical protein